MLTSPKFRLFIRLCTAIFIITLMGVAMVTLPGHGVQAEAGAAPAYQATSYPAGDTPEPTSSDEGYPAGPTDTAAAPAASATAGPSPTRANTRSQTPTLGVSTTPTETQTPKPDVFRTEDSEMGGALTTPPASETPGPSLTPAFTTTAQASPSQTGAAVTAGKSSAGGFGIDWGLFWIGFSIPVILGCGAVLYLLDRKPSLFR